jgi:hypothetical protein
MIPIALALLLMQQPQSKPPELRCGKYQHLVPDHLESCSTGSLGCLEHIPDRCADDLHTVTEREWAELQERLKKLESK